MPSNFHSLGQHNLILSVKWYVCVMNNLLKIGLPFVSAWIKTEWGMN